MRFVSRSYLVNVIARFSWPFNDDEYDFRIRCAIRDQRAVIKMSNLILIKINMYILP